MENEEGLVFWIRIEEGRRNGFKREDGIERLGLSGPLSKQLFNRTDELIALLEHRNDWARIMNALHPNLPLNLQAETYERFVFPKFGREFELTFDAAKVRWSLGLLKPRKPDTDDAHDRRPPPEEGGGGSGMNKGAEIEPMPRAPAAKPKSGDEYRPISSAPRRARAKRASRAAFLWRLCAATRQSPRFRHITSLLQATIAQANDALRQFAEQAQNALLLAHGWDGGLANLAVTSPAHFVQDARFGAVREPQVVERAGRTLTVWTFSLYEKPNWECWLFGRLREDDQIAV